MEKKSRKHRGLRYKKQFLIVSWRKNHKNIEGSDLKTVLNCQLAKKSRKNWRFRYKTGFL